MPANGASGGWRRLLRWSAGMWMLMWICAVEVRARDVVIFSNEVAGLFVVRGDANTFNVSFWTTSAANVVNVPASQARVVQVTDADPSIVNPNTKISDLVYAFQSSDSLDAGVAMQRLLNRVNEDPTAVEGFEVLRGTFYSESESSESISRQDQSTIVIMGVVLVYCCVCTALYCILYCCGCNYYLASTIRTYSYRLWGIVASLRVRRRRKRFFARLADDPSPDALDFQSLRILPSSSEQFEEDFED